LIGSNQRRWKIVCQAFDGANDATILEMRLGLLLNTPEIANALQNVPHKGFVAIGSSDHHVNAAVMENLRPKLETMVFVGANHSFELENDVLGSVQIQLELTKQMLGFLE
jgi:hypothetical protein